MDANLLGPLLDGVAELSANSVAAHIFSHHESADDYDGFRLQALLYGCGRSIQRLYFGGWRRVSICLGYLQRL